MIIHQIAQGNYTHFDLLVSRYKNRLFGYILHRIPDWHRAEDLVQEVFLRAFRAMTRKAAIRPDKVGAWLFTIARNCLAESFRSGGRKPLLLERELAAGGGPVPFPKPPGPDGHDPGAEMRLADERRRIESLLARLPEEQAEVIALRVFGELTLGEIAESTGRPLGTVKSRMRYGLLKIKQFMGPDWEKRYGH
jgi:RNA polymerase sigma-70 factor (ECF subfamily)